MNDFAEGPNFIEVDTTTIDSFCKSQRIERLDFAKIADNRGRVTCLFGTQFPPQSGRFSPVFSASEARDLSAI